MHRLMKNGADGARTTQGKVGCWDCFNLPASERQVTQSSVPHAQPSERIMSQRTLTTTHTQNKRTEKKIPRAQSCSAHPRESLLLLLMHLPPVVLLGAVLAQRGMKMLKKRMKRKKMRRKRMRMTRSRVLNAKIEMHTVRRRVNESYKYRSPLPLPLPERWFWT